MGPNKSEIDGSQCHGWLGEAREGGWRGGFVLYNFFFFSNVIIINYIIQKTRGR